MGIIGDIGKFLTRTYNTVKNTVAGNDNKPSAVEKPKTLNQQANTLTAQRMPTSNVGSFANSLNNLGVGNVAQDNNTVPKIDFSIDKKENILGIEDNNVSLANKITDKVGKTALNVWGDIQDVGEDLMTAVFSIPYKYKNYAAKSKAQTDYNKEVDTNKKHFTIGAYNNSLGGKDQGSVYEMKPKDAGLWEVQRSRIIQQLETATTEAEREKILQDAYKDTLDNWKVSPVYDNSGPSPKDFTDEERNALLANKVKSGSYKPTYKEWNDYINMDEDNRDMMDETKNKYAYYLGEVETPKSEKLIKEQENFFNLAKSGIEEKIDNRLASGERSEGIRNVNDIVNTAWGRVGVVEEHLSKLNDEAMQTPELQRNEAERYIIEVYNNNWARAKEKLAGNINDYLTRQLNEGVNDKGQIEDALRKFSDGKELNDILTDGLGDILGIDVEGPQVFGKVSFVDLINRFNNEASYKYEQGTTSNIFYKGWNWFEHQLEPVGEQRGEAGQAVLGRLPTKIVNTIASVPKLRRGRNAPSAAYLDADFSIGKLIETDDSITKRTIKKYALQFGEYVPEGIGTVAPDILLTIATSGGSAPTLLRSVGKIGKFKRWKRANDFIESVQKSSALVDKTIKGFERIGKIGEEIGNINTRTKRFFNIVDRSLSQLAVGQSLDAKLSAYDTEPYSYTSFLLSVFGSALGDVLPEAKDFWGLMRTGAKGGHAWTKGTGVWDLVDFISESDENASAIARAMGKGNKATFTEQDLKNYVRTFAEVTDAAKAVYEKLGTKGKEIANQWTKELMYNYVKQNYGANSRIGKAVRDILINKNTSPADIIKYTGSIPGIVKIGPYQSVIKLTHGTLAGVTAKGGGFYDVKLDNLNGGFGDKVYNGFTFQDIQDLSKIKGYEDVLENRKNLFRKIQTKGNDGKTRTKRLLTEDGLDRFGLELENQTLDGFGVTISEAENVREILKERMAGLKGNNLSKETIDALADGGGYNEVVNDIKNILC